MRIHLADTPISINRLIVSMMAGHPYRLVSYLYVKSLPDPVATLRSLVDGDDRALIVDSGLFSFMFGSEQGKMPETYDAYRDYTRKYLDDMAAWGLDCYLVEADTQRLLGMEATFKLREEFKPLGERCMYVWHQPEGLDGLVKLAKEVDFLGIGLPELRMIASGGASAASQSTRVDKMANDLMRRVHKACGDSPPRIHLLGCTVASLMETTLAWSCDSTSWLAGVKYGQGYLWTEKKGLHNISTRSARYKRWIEMACDANPIATDFARSQNNPDYYILCMASAYAYAVYQRWLDSRYTPRPARGDALPGGPL